MKRILDSPLTQEERQFAEEKHEVIYMFLLQNHLPKSEWYDVAAFGFLNAVRVWFTTPDLHKWHFSTIAFKKMKSAIWNYRRMEGRKKRTTNRISLRLDELRQDGGEMHESIASDLRMSFTMTLTTQS